MMKQSDRVQAIKTALGGGGCPPMNKYHDGRLLEWMKRMSDAGWMWYLFEDPGYIWRHADEPVFLSVSESKILFRAFVDNGTMPSPYEVQAWQDGSEYWGM